MANHTLLLRGLDPCSFRLQFGQDLTRLRGACGCFLCISTTWTISKVSTEHESTSWHSPMWMLIAEDLNRSTIRSLITPNNQLSNLDSCSIWSVSMKALCICLCTEYDPSSIVVVCTLCLALRLIKYLLTCSWMKAAGLADPLPLGSLNWHRPVVM